jgi:broad specificity phosphatase PhoE
VTVEFVLVQHAEKHRTAGDPGLTSVGVQQAARTAAVLVSRHRSGERIAGLFASPTRRTRETAAPLAAALGLPTRLDARLRERMNWGDGPAGQSLDDFLREWARTTADRDFTPASGESSRVAGARLLAALDDLATNGPGGRLVLVTHGGVTVDLLRTLVGDDALQRQHPTLLAQGIPPAAVTRLRRRSGGYVPMEVASVANLVIGDRSPASRGERP